MQLQLSQLSKDPLPQATLNQGYPQGDPHPFPQIPKCPILGQNSPLGL